jgi:hypothetical protein
VSAIGPLLSVIVPARSCAGPLWRCLEALTASTLPRDQWELIVVDDASDDDTTLVAAHFADTVMLLPAHAHGADYARNRGAEVSRGQLLVFVSADVCVRPDTLRAFASAFHDANVGAVSGMYEYLDDRNALTEYRALYNQFIRTRATGDVDAFFPGLAAVRRSALLRAGGFDEWGQDRPRVAALELGRRIRATGHRVLLDSTIRGVHLKRCSFADTLSQTLRDHGVPDDAHSVPSAEAANAGLRGVRNRERLVPVLCWLSVGSAVAVRFGAPSAAASGSAGSLAAATLLSIPFFAHVAKQRGMWSLMRVAPLHFGGSLLVGAARLTNRVLRSIIGEPRPAPAIEAFVEVGFKTWPPVPQRPTPVVAAAAVPERPVSHYSMWSS